MLWLRVMEDRVEIPIITLKDGSSATYSSVFFPSFPIMCSFRDVNARFCDLDMFLRPYSRRGQSPSCSDGPVALLTLWTIYPEKSIDENSSS